MNNCKHNNYRYVLCCIVLIVFVLTPSICTAATYYVDATGGDDSRSGLSEPAAWKSISKVNNTQFAPGDTILFKRGETWRERLTVNSSGSSNSPITYGAYGSGDKPLLLGSEELIGRQWTHQGNNIWRTEIGHQARTVFFNKIHDGIAVNMSGFRQNESGRPDEKYEWRLNSSLGSTFLEIYSQGNPSVYYSSIEAENSDNVIYVDGDYIKLENLDARGTDGGDFLMGIIQVAGDHVEISHCYTSFSTVAGIYGNGSRWESDPAHHLIVHDCEVVYTSKVESQAITVGGDHCEIYRNNVHDNYGEAIDVWYGARHAEIYDNFVQNTNYYAVGIYVDGGSNVNIYNNYVTKSAYGISIADEVGTYNVSDITIHHNICNDNFVGIYIGEDVGGDTGENIRVYNNTVYGSTSRAAVFKAGFNVDVRNNIFHDPRTALDVENGNKVALNNNCYFSPNPGSSFIAYNGTSYSMAAFADYKSATGQDSSSMTADPQLRDTAQKDFSLTPGSACIDAGTDIGLVADYAGTSVPQGAGVDIGAVEYIVQSQAVPLPPENLHIITIE